jgi:hypothetical protein
MQTKSETATATPPRLINAVIAGFNVAARHVQLILFPAILDLFLWLGPHLSIKGTLQPLFDHWVQTVGELGSSDMTSLLVSSKPEIQSLINHFNLLGLIRTWPIGVPSLMASLNDSTTPFGNAATQDIASLEPTVVAALVILVVGLGFGSIFFNLVAYFCAERNFEITFARRFSWGFFHTITLTLLLLVILMVIAVPAMLILSVIIMLSPGIAQIILLVMSFILLWLLLPFVFSPHGIFSYGLSAISSLLTSMRLVKGFLPGTGMFLVVIFLLSEGLDILWRAAPPDSWMTLVGIVGHAFITTGLLAASFIYYQGGMRWMQESLQKMVASANKA